MKQNVNEIDDEKVVDCVIIYPDVRKSETFENRQLKDKEIDGFTKFYKCGIKLPLKQKTTN
jgi:hypothetical protein